MFWGFPFKNLFLLNTYVDFSLVKYGSYWLSGLLWLTLTLIGLLWHSDCNGSHSLTDTKSKWHNSFNCQVHYNSNICISHDMSVHSSNSKSSVFTCMCMCFMYVCGVCMSACGVCVCACMFVRAYVHVCIVISSDNISKSLVKNEICMNQKNEINAYMKWLLRYPCSAF